MKVRIEKPPIPIIFLDTFFFIDLIKNRHLSKKPLIFSKQLELVNLIYILSSKKKVLCPQGDQQEEYELGKYEAEIRKEQVRLSHGISVTYHWGVKNWQSQIAIKAYIEKREEVVYDYRSIFHSDPIRELDRALSQQYIVDCHIPTPKEWIDLQKKTKQELADEFERLRKEKLKMNVKFSDWVKHEKLGTHDAILNTLKTVLPKLIKQEPLTEEETNGLQLLGDFSAYYSHYAKKDADPKEVMAFLRSEYYGSIPYIDIQSGLFASLLTQSGAVKDTDNFDFHQVSQMLPYSSYFLTDSSLKHRLTTNPLAYDKKYGVKVYSIREIQALIDDLSKL